MTSARSLVLTLVAVFILVVALAAQQPVVSSESHHDTSPPLRSLTPILPTGPQHIFRPRHTPVRHHDQPDPLAQAATSGSTSSTYLSITPGQGFDGIGQSTGYNVPGAPSDSNGAAGSSQFVETVNLAFAVYDKTTGRKLYGPAAINTLWSGFGGPCQNNNDGDPIVLYDHLANRWVLSQFAVTGGPPFYECIAVSQTSDATGKWYRYAFSYPYFPDYPKMGIWPDAYYTSYNMFEGNYYPGPRLCALHRSNMLQGKAASQQCVQLGYFYSTVLPADLDGKRLPPSGSPEIFVALGLSNDLLLWRYHVSWSSPSTSKVTGPTKISIASFTQACASGSCIPQSWTTQKLDAIGDRLMYRLAYRNFGTYQALVTNHTVKPGTGAAAAIRWYELRNTTGSWSLYQQSTYAPDKNSRWMASMAMDKTGHIALGYSVSSPSMHPGVRYNGRSPWATKDFLQGENSLVSGGGSQHDIDRWGDYTSMSVDPADDCTFWYTNQYLTSSGSFNWSTRIASFKFPTCY